MKRTNRVAKIRGGDNAKMNEIKKNRRGGNI